MLAEDSPPMVFDVEKHEKDRQKFLAALYELAAEVRREQLGGVPDPTVGGAHAYAAAERAGIGRPDALRIMMELKEDGQVDTHGGGNDTGPYMSLTRGGVEVAENY